MNVISTIKKSIVGGLLLSAVGGALYYGYQAQRPVYSEGYTISPYNEARDKAFIYSEFKAHWCLLVMTAEYDIEFMLTHKAPNKREPIFLGKMDITMLCDNNKPIGFITYFMRTPYQGEILFLDINDAYQGKHLGEKLVLYACESVKKRGAKIMKMFTYTKNTRARNLYKRCGFAESEVVDGVGLYFRKEL